MNEQHAIRRRSFLALAAAPLSAGALAPPPLAPNDRVVLGLIGVGVRGRDHHLKKLLANPRVEIAAICDVDRTHADFAAQIAAARTGRKPLVFYDFRQLLEVPSIDAVVIAAPDHWHSIISIQSVEAGKDVYCEKPLTLFIEEGRRVVQAARQYGTVFQVGSQQRSDWRFRHAIELVRSGRIGRLTRITTHLGNPGTTEGAFVHPGVWEPVETPPPELDWNMWLGPAPYKGLLPEPLSLRVPLSPGPLGRPHHRLGRAPQRHRAMGAGHG